jgi:hypothetical protein
MRFRVSKVAPSCAGRRAVVNCRLAHRLDSLSEPWMDGLRRGGNDGRLSRPPESAFGYDVGCVSRERTIRCIALR